MASKPSRPKPSKLKIISINDPDWHLVKLSNALHISISEISESLNRSRLAHLIDHKKKKLKLKPEEIKHMYICPSGYDKMNAELSKIYDVPKWTSEATLNEGYIKEGYSYFESTEVMIKKKKMTLLLQLLNPGF